MDRHLVVPKKIEGAEGYVRAFRPQGHYIQVHAVELDVRVEHRQTRGGEVYGGKLHIVAVQCPFDHSLMQAGRVLSAGLRMKAFRFGSYRHQQCSGAAGQVRHVQGCRKFVVAPVHPWGPIVKHQPGQKRSRRHRRVIGAGELGVGQQGVEQPPRQVVSFQPAGVFHRLNQMNEGRTLDFLRPVAKNAQDVGSQLKNRHVVNILANVPPGLAQPRNALSQGFAYGRNVFVGRRQAVLEGEGVEEHQAPDAQGSGPVLFLVGVGDDVGDAAGDSSVLCNLRCRLFQSVPKASAAAATRSTPSSSNGRVRRLSAISATEPVLMRVAGTGLPREPCTHHCRSVAASRLVCVSSSCRSLVG